MMNISMMFLAETLRSIEMMFIMSELHLLGHFSDDEYADTLKRALKVLSADPHSFVKDTTEVNNAKTND